MTVRINAYAKINLFLDVTGKREDGYHDVLSLMQSVDLADEISVSVSDREGEITLTCNETLLPTDERNLAYRAANTFFSAATLRKETQIHLQKRIPVSAGLAGGSADAAAVLLGLNYLCGEPFTTSELCSLGKTLGADIPFCIVGGACEVRGIGEILTPCTPLPIIPMVIAKRGSGISTPTAYRALDERYHGFTGSFSGGTAQEGQYETVLSAMRSADAKKAASAFYNVFEPIVLPQHADAAALKVFLKEHGALAAMMSGSGPSVFGVFECEDDARRAVTALNEGETRPIAFVTHPIATIDRENRFRTSD